MATRRVKKKAPARNEPEVPNQVFLAVPWRTAKTKYEAQIDKLRKKFPLSFVIVGRDKTQDAEDLLEIIKTKLLASSYAIFDATGGNANVSLEYGFAEAYSIPRALYLSTHKASDRSSKDAPIIADLAGKRRNHYKNEAGLQRLLGDFSKEHPYTRRLEQYLAGGARRRDRGAKKRHRALALKIIHGLDGDGQARRTDLVQQLLADVSRYSRREIDEAIRSMHSAGLIESLQGPYSTVTVR